MSNILDTVGSNDVFDGTLDLNARVVYNNIPITSFTFSLNLSGFLELTGSGIDTFNSIEEISFDNNSTFYNLFVGTPGANSLSGTAGADLFFGFGGDDVYIVGLGDVVVEAAGQGIDEVRSSVSWTLGANLENLRLVGSNAINGTGNELANIIRGDYNRAANQLIGLGGDDIYIVEQNNDTIIEVAGQGIDEVRSYISWTLGSNIENLRLVGSNAINGTGNELANIIRGDYNLAANQLIGLGGDDTYIVEQNNDTIIEAAGQGIDEVRSYNISWTLGANLENLSLMGFAVTNGTGNELGNVIRGDSNLAANQLIGLAGDDTYYVGLGDVVVEAFHEGIDEVRSSVSWTLGDNLENLTLLGSNAINGTGNALGNTIVGNSAANTLKGLEGSDTLNGHGGDDFLFGDLGGTSLSFSTDTFVYDLAEPFGHDVIQDFNADVRDILMFKNLSDVNGDGHIDINDLAALSEVVDSDDAGSGTTAKIMMYNSTMHNNATFIGSIELSQIVAGIAFTGSSSIVDYEFTSSYDVLTQSLALQMQDSDPYVFDYMGPEVHGLRALAPDGISPIQVINMPDISSGTLGSVLDFSINANTHYDFTLHNGPIQFGHAEVTNVPIAVGSTIPFAIDTSNDGPDVTWIVSLGTNGNDEISGTELLYGLNGDDTLLGGIGGQFLNGGEGSDTASYRTAAVGVTASLANPSSNTGDALGDTYVSIENLEGSYYADLLEGDANNNILIGGADSDVLDGGSGLDTASYRTAAVGVTASLSNPSSNTGDALGDVYTSIENLEGSDFADWLEGDANDNIINARSGADWVIGGAGNDTLNGDLVSTRVFQLSVTDDLGGDIGNFDGWSLTFETTSGPVVYTSATDTDLYPIEDLSIIVSDIIIPTLPDNITNIMVSIFGLDHTYANDLDVRLIVPGVGSFELFTDVGGGREFMDTTLTFDDLGVGLVNFADGVTFSNPITTSSWHTESGSGLLSLLAEPTLVEADQIFYGEEGNDLINAGYGDDTLMGGEGDDLLIGGAGADMLDGEVGSDTASYRTATEGVFASLNNPSSNTGDAFGDTYVSIENLEGSDFADSLEGDANNNILIGGAGADALDGGLGIDTASYRTATVGVTASLDDPSSNTEDALGDTYVSIENLEGSDFADTLTGDANNNILIGGEGADALDGGLGIDTASYSTATVGVTASLDDTSSNTGDAFGDTYVSIENLRGSNFSDNLIGDLNDNTLTGAGGDDLLLGKGGNDTLNGGEGNDILHGDDSLPVFSAQLIERDTFGSLSGSVFAPEFGDSSLPSVQIQGGINVAGDKDFYKVYLYAGETLRMDIDTTSGSSDTILTFFNGAGAVLGQNDDNTAPGESFSINSYLAYTIGVEGYYYVAVSNYAQFLGAGGVNSGSSASGTNTYHLNLSLQNATLSDLGVAATVVTEVEPVVPSGDDTLIGGAGGDMLNGGSGLDTASYRTATVGVVASLSNPASNTGDALGDVYVSIENLEGSSHDDTLTGNNSNNVITGGEGNDTLNGGSGGTDTLNGGNGDDTLFAGNYTSSNVYDGGTGNDVLTYQNDFTSLGVVIQADGTGSISKTYLGTLYGTDTFFNIEKFIGTNSSNGDTFTVMDKEASYIFDGVNGDGTSNNFDKLVYTFLEGSQGITVTVTGYDSKGFMNGSVGKASGGTDTFENIYEVFGSDRADTFTGHSGTDRFNGGAGDDLLIGNSGGDVLTGGEGNDTLYGDDNILPVFSAQLIERDTFGSLSGSVFAPEFGDSSLPSVQIQGGINVGGDKDFYKVYLYAGETLRMDIDQTTGDDDTILTFFNGVGAVLANADGGTAPGESFTIDNSYLAYTIAVTGYYYVAVSNYAQFLGTGGVNSGSSPSSTNTYHLNLSLQNATLLGLGTSAAVVAEVEPVVPFGDDALNGGGSADFLDGGNGNDTASYSMATAGVTASLANPALNTGDAAGDFYVSIENLEGSQFADVLIGDGNNNILNGLQGADSMTGGIGDDIYVVDNFGDVVVEMPGEGIDLVQSSTSWTLGASVENLLLTGTSFINGTGNALGNSITGNSGGNTLTGDLRQQIAIGPNVDSSALLPLGDDILHGGLGNDTLVGDVCGPTSTSMPAQTIINELLGAGSPFTTPDTYILNAAIQVTFSSDNNIFNMGIDELNGGDNNDTLVGDVLGQAGPAIIVDFNSDNNTFNFEGDELLGGNGNDILAGDVYRSSGGINDIVIGSVLSVNVSYSGSPLFPYAITENSGGNVFNFGSDRLEGGAGNDTLIGDVRAIVDNNTSSSPNVFNFAEDTFVFNLAEVGGLGSDTILDFNKGGVLDKLEFHTVMDVTAGDSLADLVALTDVVDSDGVGPGATAKILIFNDVAHSSQIGSIELQGVTFGGAEITDYANLQVAIV